MTITLPFWTVPVALNVLFCGLALYKLPNPQGPYDIGSFIDGTLKMGGAVIGSLLVWIAYLLVLLAT